MIIYVVTVIFPNTTTQRLKPHNCRLFPFFSRPTGEGRKDGGRLRFPASCRGDAENICSGAAGEKFSVCAPAESLLMEAFFVAGKKGKRKKRTFCIAFAMNTNFLLLFPFFGDILYSRNGCLRFASVDLQKSLLPLITIGDGYACPLFQGLRMAAAAFLCRKKKRQKKNDDADASPPLKIAP